MPPLVSIRKELHLPAPAPHIAIYAQNPVYTSREGRTLLEAVKEEARTGSRRYYDRRIYRRRSEDNGRSWVIEEPLLAETSEADVDTGYSEQAVPMHYLDPDNGLLVCLTDVSECAVLAHSAPLVVTGRCRRRGCWGTTVASAHARRRTGR